jgi:hypothetical protein
MAVTVVSVSVSIVVVIDSGRLCAVPFRRSVFFGSMIACWAVAVAVAAVTVAVGRPNAYSSTPISIHVILAKLLKKNCEI